MADIIQNRQLCLHSQHSSPHHHSCSLHCWSHRCRTPLPTNATLAHNQELWKKITMSIKTSCSWTTPRFNLWLGNLPSGWKSPFFLIREISIFRRIFVKFQVQYGFYCVFKWQFFAISKQNKQNKQKKFWFLIFLIFSYKLRLEI